MSFVEQLCGLIAIAAMALAAVTPATAADFVNGSFETQSCETPAGGFPALAHRVGFQKAATSVLFVPPLAIPKARAGTASARRFRSRDALESVQAKLLTGLSGQGASACQMCRTAPLRREFQSVHGVCRQLILSLQIGRRVRDQRVRSSFRSATLR